MLMVARRTHEAKGRQGATFGRVPWASIRSSGRRVMGRAGSGRTRVQHRASAASRVGRQSAAARAPAPARRSDAIPRSRRLTNISWSTTRWSSTSMSRRRPAEIARTASRVDEPGGLIAGVERLGPARARREPPPTRRGLPLVQVRAKRPAGERQGYWSRRSRVMAP